MAFKLDPVSALGAIQKAKGWQQQSFGNTSPMSFSSGLVANKGSQIGPWDIMDEQAKIITPEVPFSNNATDTILGGQIDAYGNAAELGAQALGNLGAVHRSNKQYEFAKELAEKRKKAAEKKSGGGGIWGSVGKIAGGFLGGAVAGPAGATIGSQAGGFLGGLIG
jgi:hypothetical protein